MAVMNLILRPSFRHRFAVQELCLEPESSLILLELRMILSENRFPLFGIMR
jgi:hypothetical protein